jgi:hypothetical protein
MLHCPFHQPWQSLLGLKVKSRYVGIICDMYGIIQVGRLSVALSGSICVHYTGGYICMYSSLLICVLSLKRVVFLPRECFVSWSYNMLRKL